MTASGMEAKTTLALKVAAGLWVLWGLVLMLAGAVVLSSLVPFVLPPLDARSVGLLALVALFGTVGQLMLIRALSMAEAGLLAPFNYAGLVYAMVLGFVLFAEVPDAATLFGALVIAGAGIYVWHRETRARSRTKPPDVE